MIFYTDCLDAPEFTLNPRSVRLNSSKEASRKETLQLNCNATGNPIPMVVWYKVSFNETVESFSAKAVSDKWKFVINGAVTSDSGKYRCKAWNHVGYTYSKVAKVFVQGKSEIRLHNQLPKLCLFPSYRAST